MVNATRGRALFPGVDLGVFKGSGLVLQGTEGPGEGCAVSFLQPQSPPPCSHGTWCPTPARPPAHLWATASRVPRDSCQVTTAVSPAEGSHHFVGQVGGTGGPPVGVLAGREG